jgi:GNAT superfamily N-acetyltransferase
MLSEYQIFIDHNAKSEQVDLIKAGVLNYNEPFLGKREKFCVFLKDSNDQIVGGATGSIFPLHGLLFLDLVHIEKTLRGQGYGTKLLLEVEAEAKRKGCTAIMLDTFSFQAEGFYSKLGYQRVGVIENQIGKYDRIYMKKDIQK